MFFSNRKSKRAISYQVPKYLFTSKFSTAFAFLGIEAQELKRVRTPTERAATKILCFVFIPRIFKLFKKKVLKGIVYYHKQQLLRVSSPRLKLNHHSYCRQHGTSVCFNLP